jgi:hypothetical protein
VQKFRVGVNSVLPQINLKVPGEMSENVHDE